MRAIGRLVAFVSVGGVLTFTLAGCPIIAGINNDYTSGPGLADGATPDGNVGPDGSTPDGHTGPDGSHPKDAHPGDGREPDGHVADGHVGDSGKDSGHPKDGTSPVEAGGDTSGECPASCSVAEMAGWTLVAWDPSGASDGGPTCPAGFTQTTLELATGTGSCACGSCTVSPPPDCAAGGVTSTRNASAGLTTCTASGDTYSSNGGACNPGGIVTPPMYSAFSPVVPTGGTCSAAATRTDPPTDMSFMCQPTTTCATSVCDAYFVTHQFKTCLYQAGAQTCPSGLTQRDVGTSITTQCSTCDCSVGATTCAGTFDIFAGGSCAGGQRVSIPVDGTCAALTGVQNGDSYQYTVTTTPSCDPGTSSAMVVTTGAATLCCQ
jgi:hypothetical protein